MVGQQKLPVLWACMLLMAVLCPMGVQCKGGKGGGGKGGKGGFFGKGKSEKDSQQAPPPGKSSSSNQGLKLAGAAAAGAIGGAAIGYGLGSLGKTKHRPGGHGYDKHGPGQQVYQRDGHGGIHNLSNKRLFRNGATTTAGSMSGIFVTLGSIVPFLIGAWIRGL